MSTESDTPAPEAQIGFNEHHRRRLATSFRHIDQVLTEAETIMASGDSPSPFRRYTPDLTPVQRRVTHDHIVRIREAMRRILEELDIALPAPDCGALWAVRTQLTMLSNITVEELGARHMRGYGALPDAASGTLNRIRSELQAQMTRLDDYLSQSGAGVLQERLRRLEKTTDEARLLRELDRVITDHGLVEFRGAMGMLLDRMENLSFEIGVLGRVSSGKSSLLNHLLGRDVLPIGVTPVTAVPINRSTISPQEHAPENTAVFDRCSTGSSPLQAFCCQGRPLKPQELADATVQSS